jgi:DNA-binding response OmpR family regulator
MKILVIEDEPRILEFLRLGLEAEGFTVDGVEDGAAGLAAALSEPYELVVLDLLLPRLDGLRLLAELRRERADLPVLVLSARSDLPTKLRSFDALVARVRVHLRRGRDGTDGASLRIGHLSLDLARRRAETESCSIDLSDREFRLLYHLVTHAGEIVSRERLLSEVWGYSFDPGSNVVDVCVRRLRKKLGPTWPIETVRHAGYRLATA